jgi:hypothetical protein
MVGYLTVDSIFEYPALVIHDFKLGMTFGQANHDFQQSK